MGAFSAFTEKKSKRNKRETPTVSSYYTKLARKAVIFRYVILIAVVGFTVYSLSFHSAEITMENFEYMMKFVNQGEEAASPKGTLITFDGSEGNRGVIYKGDLAVLGNSGLTVTGWDGDIILQESFAYDHPKITQNGEHLFCYDLGGKELKIFNSYSHLQTLSFDYPIYGFSTSQSARFAVISSAKGYRTTVHIFDKEFRQIYTCYFGNKYADFVALHKDGVGFITASHYSENANLVTVLSRFRTDSSANEPLFSQTFIGEIPLDIYYTDDGYCLLTSDALRFFNNNDEIVSELKFAEKKLLSGNIYGNRALMTYGLKGLSGGTNAVVYDKNGKEEFSVSFDYSLSDTLINGDILYALAPGKLSISNISTGETEHYNIPTSYSSLIAYDDRLIIFSENQAEYFDASKHDKTEASE